MNNSSTMNPVGRLGKSKEQTSESNLVSDQTRPNPELEKCFEPPETTAIRSHTSKTDIQACDTTKDIIKDRFELIERLGAGGMGEVFRAKDLVRERMQDISPYVALKLLKGDLTHLHDAIQALQREAKKAQTLSHPNIVTVYDFDIDNNIAFLTMEYLPGQSLHDYLRENKAMPYRQAIKVIEQIARGLAYAHQEGFVHADIKPSNIYLQDDGNVKLLDFGIAKAFRNTQETHLGSEKLTQNAFTPAYASPQILDGHQPLPCDDVYSLAVVAYMLITGMHPFLDSKGFAIPSLDAQARNLNAPEVKDISRRHLKAFKQGLRFSREKRYVNAGEFIDAIKPRNIKKEFGILLAAGSLTSLLIFSTQFGLNKVTPIIDSLPQTMKPLKNMLNEADQLLENNDIDMAHRLYSQVKLLLDNDFNPLDAATQSAQTILKDRRNKVISKLTDRIDTKDITAFQLKEIQLALEFLLKDELTQDKDYVNKKIREIQSILNTTTDKK